VRSFLVGGIVSHPASSRNTTLPHTVLPHGPGLQLLGERIDTTGEWLTYSVSLTSGLSVCDSRGHIEPEIGLEIMAQACGMLLALEESHSKKAIGVVASVRGYEYTIEPFSVGQTLIVRVRPEMTDASLVVCEGELCTHADLQVIQRARITLLLRGIEP
jgi:predicted hotdog family 3-hydroxylacyl-ACP dehydratase